MLKIGTGLVFGFQKFWGVSWYHHVPIGLDFPDETVIDYVEIDQLNSFKRVELLCSILKTTFTSNHQPTHQHTQLNPFYQKKEIYIFTI